jgi:hypothetical protein
VPEGSIDRVYRRLRDCGVTIVPTLTGFVPDQLAARPRRPMRGRPYDVVYRGRPVPHELGDLGYEKVAIAQRFIDAAAQYGLANDVDWREEARIYGDDWIEFMSSGRATLGTESGASIVDFDQSIAAAVDAYVRGHPGAGYREVADAVLKKHEGNVVINTISPRAFEAICLGTALVLFPGEYSGILVPWRHYIPLAKDFSNLGEVVSFLTDLPFLERLTQTAYDEIVGSGAYSYSEFTRKVDDALAELSLSHEGRGRVAASIGRFDADQWRRSLDDSVKQIAAGLAPRPEPEAIRPEPETIAACEIPVAEAEAQTAPELAAGDPQFHPIPAPVPRASKAHLVAKWLLPAAAYNALRPVVHSYFSLYTYVRLKPTE